MATVEEEQSELGIGVARLTMLGAVVVIIGVQGSWQAKNAAHQAGNNKAQVVVR